MPQILYLGAHPGQWPELREWLTPLLYRSLPEEERTERREALQAYLRRSLEDSVVPLQDEDPLSALVEDARRRYPDQTPEWMTGQGYTTRQGHYELVYGQVEGASLSPLACLSLLDQTAVHGPAYLWANDHHPESETGYRLRDATLEDMVRILRRRFYQTAIYEEPDGTCHRLYYQDHEALVGVVYGREGEGCARVVSERVVQLHGYTLVATYYRQSDASLNPGAGRLLRAPVRGGVLWCHLRGEGDPEQTGDAARVWDTLSLHEYRILSQYALGTGAWLREESQTDSCHRYQHLLTLAKEAPAPPCANCGTPITSDPVVCPGCLHTPYCTAQCQARAAATHEEECTLRPAN